jgi:hypothetical protein
LSEADVILGQVMPAIGATVGAYRSGLLSRIESDAVAASATLGERLLARIWHRIADRDATRRAVGGLAGAGGDPAALAAFGAQLRAAIAEDVELRRDLAALVEAGSTGSAVGVTFAGDVRFDADRSSVAAVVIQGGVQLGGPTRPARR